MTDRPTVAGAMARAESAHQKMDNHEAICALRYEQINTTLGELKDGAKAQNKLQWGVLVAIAAFLAVQVFQDLKDGPEPAAVHAAAQPGS